MISAEERYHKKRAKILGKTMAYVDEGEGDPIVFLHGNPTSSYLWRNIIPHVAKLGRCVAPDLIGMGDSDKLDNSGPDSYRFVEHREYLDALLEHIGISKNVILVVHDWGSSLGLDWARRHAGRVQGIAYMEALVQPLTWDDWPDNTRGIFRGLRAKAGDTIVLEKNGFVETILPGSILRNLSEAEMDVYRRPYLQPGEDRRPTLTWPRQIPIDGDPEDVTRITAEYAEWLAGSDIAKLFINGTPGAILTGPQREFCRTWPNQEEVTVKGVHFLQEDSPDEIGAALADFVGKLRGGDQGPVS